MPRRTRIWHESKNLHLCVVCLRENDLIDGGQEFSLFLFRRQYQPTYLMLI